MDLVVEELEQLKRKLQITIPEEVVTERIDKAYKELNRQIRMPGFRPGKIPRKILEKQVPVQSFTNMLQDLLQEYYEKALQESGIVPAGSPEIDHSELQDVKTNTPLKFSVTLDVKPEITIKGYKGLRFKKIEAQVTAAEVDRAVESILEQYGSFEHHEDDYAAQKNDFLTLDFEGFFEGKPLENGDARDLKVRIGENKMIKGFEDQLVGHKLGEEFEVKALLPPNWDNKIRRVSVPIPGVGEDKHEDMATFHVKIKELKKRVLPELTDDIAQREGFSTADEFRRSVKTRLQSIYEQKEEIRIKEEMFDRLVQENPMEAPESMVENELKFMVEGMKFQIEQSGMKLEDSGFEEDKAKEEWRSKAENNCKGYLILESIASQEDIHVSQLDLEEEFKTLAEQTQQKPEEVKNKMMVNPDVLKHTSSKILGRKTMEFIYANCEFEFVKDEPEEQAK